VVGKFQRLKRLRLTCEVNGNGLAKCGNGLAQCWTVWHRAGTVRHCKGTLWLNAGTEWPIAGTVWHNAGMVWQKTGTVWRSAGTVWLRPCRLMGCMQVALHTVHCRRSTIFFVVLAWYNKEHSGGGREGTVRRC